MTGPVDGLVLGLVAAVGVHLLATRRSDPPRRFGVAPARRRRRGLIDEWMHQAGLADVAPREFVGVTVGLAAVGAALGYAVFAGVLPALGAGAFAGSVPIVSYRHRRQTRAALAQDAWPQMIDEIRILTGSSGRSIPQALFEVGARGPEALRPAFASGHREWLLSTDFPSTVATLKRHLASSTADATCETLLVAHEIGGADLDRRLSELAEDRRIDSQGRKDARSQQAGVRFARRFVVLVPLGMAVAGMSLGDGRKAYATLTGQTLVAVGIGLVVVCWVWSAQMLRLPTEERVFCDDPTPARSPSRRAGRS